MFQGFRQAKSANGGSNLSSSQFLILPQLPQKMKLASKLVKVDSKIIISLPKILIPETHCRSCFVFLVIQLIKLWKVTVYFKDFGKLNLAKIRNV